MKIVESGAWLDALAAENVGAACATDECRLVGRLADCMIRRILHRGLKILYDNDDRRGVKAEYVEKTARVMARLDVVTRPEQLNLPGFQLRRLQGEFAGYWSITIVRDWRIIFRIDRGDIINVDLVEYHESGETRTWL